MKTLACALPMLGLLGAAPADQPQPLSMDVQGLRSAKGNILVCVTRQPRYFPDCTGDPDGRHMIVSAAKPDAAVGPMIPGDYAIAVVHDENGNGRLDTFAGIPREGVGFSRNPAIRFGAPSFRSAQFAISGAPVRQDIRMKYFL